MRFLLLTVKKKQTELLMRKERIYIRIYIISTKISENLSTDYIGSKIKGSYQFFEVSMTEDTFTSDCKDEKIWKLLFPCRLLPG